MNYLYYIFIVLILLSGCKNKNEDESLAVRTLHEAMKEHKKGYYEKAVENYLFAAEYCNSRIDSIYVIPISLAARGEILYLVRSDYGAAKDIFIRLDSVGLKYSLPKYQCIAFQRLGEIYLKQHRYEDANRFYQKALKYAQKLPHGSLPLPLLYEESLIAAVGCEIEEKKVITEFRHNLLEKQLQKLIQNSDLSLKAEAYLLLNNLESLQKVGKGRFYFRTYLNFRDSLERLHEQKMQEIILRERVCKEFDQEEAQVEKQKILFILTSIISLLLGGAAFYFIRGIYEKKFKRLLRFGRQREKNWVEKEKVWQGEKDLFEVDLRQQYWAKMQNFTNQIEVLKIDYLNKEKEVLRQRQDQAEIEKNEIRYRQFFASELGRRIPHGKGRTQECVAKSEGLMCKSKEQEELLRIAHIYLGIKDLGILSEKLGRENLILYILLYVGVRQNDIAALFCVDSSTVSKRKKRMEELLGEKADSMKIEE
ncbi:MAG: hypothetical protein KBH23_04790 [Bacteroidaceae bacterium]|nr:hypothetical protein [Bacteroidaceae bacterium]